MLGNPSKVALALALTGCVVSPLELTDRRCPCASGWTCDRARDRCVQGEPQRDAALSDAGTDAGQSLDAGRDAQIDAGRDAQIDAGRDAQIDAGRDAQIDAGRDAGSDGGSMLDSTSCDDVHAGAIFCDGFESGAAMVEWDGVSTESGGAGAWTALPAYRGGGAFEASTSAPSQRAYLNKEGLSLAAIPELHLRAYVFVPSAPAIGHAAALFLSEGGPPWDGIAMEMLPGREPQLFVARADLDIPAGSSIAADRWVCIELHVTVGASGTVALDVDGAEVIRRSGVDTQTTTGYAGFTIGLSWTGSTNAGSQIVYDEVVLDDAPIGCD